MIELLIIYYILITALAFVLLGIDGRELDNGDMWSFTVGAILGAWIILPIHFLIGVGKGIKESWEGRKK